MNKFMLLSFLILIVFAGCSSSNNLLTPHPVNQTDSTNHIADYSNLPIGVSDYLSDGSPYAGMGTLGLFQLHLDAYNLTGEITSLRKTALPDVLEVVDITNFLQLAPCTDCVKLQSVLVNEDDNLVASIGIKHPFEEGDPFKPITGKNRGDLHVFNVEGIVVSNNSPINFTGVGNSVADFRLINASGYTGYLDNALDSIYPTDANIHPYILHFDDYSSGNFDPNNPMGFEHVTIPHPSGNLVMPMGSDHDFKDYIFDIDGSMDFIFAVGCTYAVSSASKSERFNPEYRIPQHNKKAASEVWVEIVENNLASGNEESAATLQINVVDISHGVPVGDALNEMLADSSVSGVSVEVPGVTAGAINFSTLPLSGTGHDPSDPLVFESEITNTAGGGEGSYLGLVKVTDSYQPGLNTSPLLDGMDGIERVDPVINPLEGLFAIPEFATYQTFVIDVMVREPVCFIQANTDEIENGEMVTFNPSDSYSPDADIVLYEYDFNYDGVTFMVDESQSVGMPGFGEPIDVPICHSMPTTQLINVALRVTDNNDYFSICGVDITVHPSPKNIPLRTDAVATDFGVREETNEGYVGFDDGQIWIYEPDYSSGQFRHQFQHQFDAQGVRFLDVSSRGDIYSVGEDRRTVNFVQFDDEFILSMRLQQTHDIRDVAEVDYLYPSSITYENGGYISLLAPGIYGDPTPRNLYSRHQWTWPNRHGITHFPPHNLPELGEGVVSFEITVGIAGGRNYDYFWVLEGAPRYEVERMTGGRRIYRRHYWA